MQVTAHAKPMVRHSQNPVAASLYVETRTDSEQLHLVLRFGNDASQRVILSKETAQELLFHTRKFVEFWA